MSFLKSWQPDVVILEGMFMINTTSICLQTKMIEYVQYLIQRYIGWYLKVGVKEIHVVFDCPGTIENHPKQIERQRRDEPITPDHEHTTFTDEMKVPSKWRNVINCRRC